MEKIVTKFSSAFSWLIFSLFIKDIIDFFFIIIEKAEYVKDTIEAALDAAENIKEIVTEVHETGDYGANDTCSDFAMF